MTVLAWHFLHPGGRLRNGEAAPPDGEWLLHDGSVVPCESGLHASKRAIDALRYAPHEERIVLCRVEVAGTVIEHGDDKLAASERRILWRLDGDTTDRVLREFARWSASRVLHLWDAPPVVRQWLETGDESLRDAAWAAARAAAGDAAWAAAGDAAWAAAGAAARAAAWAAAWDVATDAAKAAAEDAARAAARAATRAADWAAWAAARAAWAAAWTAARDAQNTELERLFNEAQP